MDYSVYTNDAFLSRVQSARKVVKDAIRHAKKSAEYQDTIVDTTTTTTSPGTTTTTTGGGGDMNTETLPTSLNEGNDAQKNNTTTEKSTQEKANEAFDVGMTLFGDDVKAIENDMNGKLQKVENEIELFLANKENVENQKLEASKAKESHPYAFPSSTTPMHPTDVDINDWNGIPGKELVGKEDMIQEAKELRTKIQFLTHASDARVALEESFTLSLNSASSGGNSSSRSNSSGGHHPSGPLTPNAELLLRASKAIVLAEESLNVDETTSKTDESMETSNNNDGDDNEDAMDDNMDKSNDRAKLRSGDAEAVDNIIIALKVELQRKTVDLHAAALALLDTAITITPSSISVREAKSSSSQQQQSSSEGVKDALDTLQLLSEMRHELYDNYTAKQVELMDCLSTISSNLYSVVLKPQVDACQDALKKGMPPPRWEIRTVPTSETSGSNSFSLSTLEWRAVVDTKEDNPSNANSSNNENDDNQMDWWTDLLLCIQYIMKFVHEKVLLSQPALSKIIGQQFFGEQPMTNAKMIKANMEDIYYHDANKLSIMVLLKRLMWDYCIPDASSLDLSSTTTTTQAQQLQKCVKEFERVLTEYAFIDTPTPLSEYADNYIKTFAQKRRTHLLSKGRQLLLDSDYHNTTQVGENVHEKRKEVKPKYLDDIDKEGDDYGMSIFVLHECSISQAASNLMALCRETMDAALESAQSNGMEGEGSKVIPSMLYRTTRELLDLFRAVIPASHGKEISTIPRAAGIFHNDCVFFAHQMLTFGLEYRDKLPLENDKDSSLKGLCTFADYVPVFRDLALQTMGDMILRQKNEITQIVSPRLEYLTEALRSNESVVELTDAETALTAGLYHLRHLTQAWKNLLSHDDYCGTIGTLVDTLFTLYLDQVMKAKDISEPSCQFVNVLFRDATRGVIEFFDSSPSQETFKEATRYCSAWLKFTAIGKFMDMSLADITEGLSEGTFRYVTGAELSRLIMAVYTDSEKRQKLLQLLSSEV